MIYGTLKKFKLQKDKSYKIIYQLTPNFGKRSKIFILTKKNQSYSCMNKFNLF